MGSVRDWPTATVPAEASGDPLQDSDPVEMDRRDPLARFRDLFDLPEGLIYLGGHSLGPPPRTMRARAEGLIGREWGTDLVAAWNRSDWLELPERRRGRLAAERLADFGVIPASPGDASQRGVQVSLRHPDGYALVQVLNARGVVGDFRGPDVMRFGLAPLYVRYRDVWNAVEALRLILVNEEHREDRFRRRGRVP